MKYRKKPIVIDAIRYFPSLTCDQLYTWAGIERKDFDCPPPFRFSEGCIFILTVEGEMRTSPGDWIIKGVKGEFYPCKNDIFEATYERM